MSASLLAPEYIRQISPYVPGKPIDELAREMGLAPESILKLASNENPLGMGAAAKTAVQAALNGLERYPDGNAYRLKQALSTRYGVPMEALILGNGSNDVLELAVRAFLTAGAGAVYSQYAFAVYGLATQSVGGRGIEVPARAFAHDLAAMADAVNADTRIVFLANPNNPTGTFIPGGLLEAFLSSMPAHVIVILDEAYNEYLPPALQYDSVGWIKSFPNLIVTRTFSKIHGLAGLRVGYGMADPAVIDLLNRIRSPFNVNSIALAAAEAALLDETFIAQSHAINRAGMDQIVAGLNTLNLQHIPSMGNFVSFRVGDAAGVNQRLLKQGVIVRPLASYGLPEWLRVTIGQADENVRFLEALSHALKG